MRRVSEDFRRRALEADFVAVIDDAGTHSAHALLERADELGAALPGLGGTVLFQADNSWHTVAAALAVGSAGGTLALINRHATKDDFAAAYEDLRPDAVVAEPDAVEEWNVEQRMPFPSRTVFDSWSAICTPRPEDAARWSGGVVVGLTSGSTGRPKGVVQSEEALRYACEHTMKINGLASGDAVAAIVPLSSTAAFCFGVYFALLLGGPLVLQRRWDRAAALERMAATGVRWTMCVPTMALQMGETAAGSGVLSGVRSITVGGGPMDRTALARAEESLGTRILRVFGMSECLGHTSPDPADPVELRLGRDGRPFPGTELRAVSPDGTRLPVGEPGRAEVRGPSLFLGYAREGRVEPPTLTEDGFFATGDLLAVHEDGSVTIMGREKDVIIRGGRNLDMTEIERSIAGCPRIARACVAPVPDELLGERVALLAVSEDGGPIALPEVCTYLAEVGVAKAKWPEYVFVVEDLPQTTVGKLDRGAARELARNLHARLERDQPPGDL
jgi:acyl-CoA synthetase (AMP-forming)/AMP-acid ligase II